MEEWRDIKGYEGLYKISSCGKVYSIWKKSLKTLQDDKDGYKKVTIYKEGKPKCIAVHRLVASNFLEKPDGKDYVNHKDGNKSNNKVDNLEWCTQSENELHAHEAGLKHTRKEVSSYIDGTFEKHFKSTIEATKWLKQNGYENASRSSISEVCNNKRISAYGRVWKYE